MYNVIIFGINGNTFLKTFKDMFNSCFVSPDKIFDVVRS